MTRCYLDSNVLVYLKNEDSPFFQESSELVLRLKTENANLFISSLCLDEFIHEFGQLLRTGVPQKHYFASLETGLNSLLQLPDLSIVNPPTGFFHHQKIISLMEKYSLRPRDAYHLLIMQANGIDGFATFDTDFKKVFAAKILTKA